MECLIYLIDLAREYNYSIEFNSKSRKLLKDSIPVSGYINYRLRKILINKLKDPKMILYHLCHELGHMISRESSIYKKWNEKYSQELMAHYFGWKIIHKYHVDISKKSWKNYYKISQK